MKANEMGKREWNEWGKEKRIRDFGGETLGEMAHLEDLGKMGG